MSRPCESCSVDPGKVSCTWGARAEQLRQARDAGVKLNTPLSTAMTNLHEEMISLGCVRAQGNKRKEDINVKKHVFAPTDGLLAVGKSTQYFVERDRAMDKRVVKIPRILEILMSRKNASIRERIEMKIHRKRQDSLLRKLYKD